ncbi:MAG: hypothetical protein GXP54_06910 [Deltaproteobacteria bacterium]|nr:hypothetical protein [Deltaproteobacteria bacterium]
MRLLSTRLSILPVVLLCAGCIKAIDAPECLTLSDCPTGKGYSSCEDGHCFKEGKCSSAGFKPGDACCPPVEGDRTGDSDCLLLAEYFGDNLTVPAFDASANLFITYSVLDQTRGSLVRLERLTPEDLQAIPVKRTYPVVVGGGEVPLPAMITRDVTVYASYDGGVNRYDASTLEIQAEIASLHPQGGLAFTANGPRSMVAWPTAGGKVVTYDEDGDTSVTHDLALQLKRPELAKEQFLAPVVSGNGLRLYLVTKEGSMVSLEVGANPIGVKASMVLPSPPSAPPVESGGRVFVPVTDGRLLAYHENEEFGFDLKWTYDLGSKAAGRPLLDDKGNLVIALLNGRVLVIRDSDSDGILAGEGDFGRDLADVTPMLTDRPRIVALAAGGASVLTLLRTDDEGVAAFSEGLRFDLEFSTSATPSLMGSRIFLPLTTSLRLLAWSLVEGLPASGYPREGGFADNTNQVLLPEDAP